MLEQAISQLAGWQWAFVIIVGFLDDLEASLKAFLFFLVLELIFM